MSRYPPDVGQWLQALAYALSKPRDIAIVGDPDSADMQALLDVVYYGYRPFQFVALGTAAGFMIQGATNALRQVGWKR